MIYLFSGSAHAYCPPVDARSLVCKLTSGTTELWSCYSSVGHVRADPYESYVNSSEVGCCGTHPGQKAQTAPWSGQAGAEVRLQFLITDTARGSPAVAVYLPIVPIAALLLRLSDRQRCFGLYRC